MNLFLEVVGEGMTGTSIWLRPGDVCRFGSDRSNELRLPGQEVNAHAGTLVCTDAGASLFKADGVLLRGQQAGAWENLVSGDALSCGPFSILLRTLPGAAEPSVESPLQGLISLLREAAGDLYAIFDAARDDKVLELLRVANCRRLSLFDGATRERMADAAPYLVAIPKESQALELLVRASWGRGWTTFLTSAMDFMAVRSRLRRSLMVTLPGGETAYFRFFDPEVLQGFAPTLDAKETRNFIQGISELLVEHKAGPDKAVRFSAVAEPTAEILRMDIHDLGAKGHCYIG